MRGTVARQLRRLSAKPGFTGPARTRLYRNLKRAWNWIPRPERRNVNAWGLLALATGVEWRPPSGEEKETSAEAVPPTEG